MTTDPDEVERLRVADELYARYACPLEEAHRGEFAAVSPDGTVLLAPTLREAVAKAGQHLGPDSWVFRIGELVVGSWR